jgi:hypothetical protein
MKVFTNNDLEKQKENLEANPTDKKVTMETAWKCNIGE